MGGWEARGRGRRTGVEEKDWGREGDRSQTETVQLGRYRRKLGGARGSKQGWTGKKVENTPIRHRAPVSQGQMRKGRRKKRN